MDRRTFAQLLASGLVLPSVSAMDLPVSPEAMIPDQGTTTLMSGILQMRFNPETRVREYRIAWGDGTFEDTTPEKWSARPKDRSETITYGQFQR